MIDSAHVFTYGSLMFEPVWTKVVSGRYQSSPALLKGYQRWALSGETYPAVVASAGGSVAGRVWRSVAPADLLALDRFEGPDYRRITVQVEVGSPGEGQHEGQHFLEAQCYLWLDPTRLSDQPWDVGRFEREHLAGFVQAYAGEPPPP